MVSPIQKPLFTARDTLITDRAQHVLPNHEVDTALRLHIRGDWGLMDWLDGLANHRALIDGRPILSVFETTAGDRFCIVTRQDESVTTVMLDDESPFQTSSANL